MPVEGTDPHQPPMPPRRPLRGRENECERLRAGCDVLTNGAAPWIALIEGDAGMGKTRLLRELADMVTDRGFQFALAGCDSIAPDRPFGPLLEALGCERSAEDDRRRAIAERAAALPSLVAAEGTAPTMGGLELGARYGIQDDLVDLLLEETDAAPLVLAVDDAQWLDVATAATIGALVRRRGDRPLGVVLAARPDPRPPELETLLHRWHEDLDTLRLDPLPGEAASELAADVLGHSPPPALVAELERAGGNAFSVVALARGFDQERPAPLDGVRASVLSRVYRLGAEAPTLLTIAAVLGVDFTPETLGVLSDRPPYDVFDVVYGASRAGLLVSNGPAFAFSHALVADQLLDEAPEAMVAAVHRSIVHHAPELGLGATTVAHHVMSVSMPDDPAAIEALCLAATEVAGYDPDLALTYLEHAAELCGRTNPRSAEVALRRSAVLCTLKRVTDAVAALDGALVFEREPARIAELRAGKARCAHLLGDLVLATDELEQLALSGMLEPADAAAAWADVATYRFWLLNGDRPWAEAERAIALADECGAVAPAVQALAAQASMASFDGEVTRGLELAAHASARGKLLPTELVIPAPGFTEGLCQLFADDLDGAIATLQRERLRVERLGDPLLANRPAMAGMLAQYLAGRWDDAIAEARAISRVCSDTGSAIGELASPVIIGLVAHFRGDAQLAEQALAEANSPTGAPEAYGVPFHLHLQALRLEAAGDPEAALALLADTVTIGRAFSPVLGTWFITDAARMLLSGVSAAPGTADRLVDGLLDEQRRVGLVGGIGIATIVACTVHGEIDQALASCDDARTSPHLLARTAALELVGTASWRADPNDGARALLAEAREGYEALGATAAAERAAAIAEPDGARRRKATRPSRPRFGWEALTPAELAVLDLVVDAKRNGEIAETLVLSKRTVESHIGSILTKVGVASRVELVVAAGRRGEGTSRPVA